MLHESDPEETQRFMYGQQYICLPFTDPHWLCEGSMTWRNDAAQQHMRAPRVGQVALFLFASYTPSTDWQLHARRTHDTQ